MPTTTSTSTTTVRRVRIDQGGETHFCHVCIQTNL
jgi:hypothetical protein